MEGLNAVYIGIGLLAAGAATWWAVRWLIAVADQRRAAVLERPSEVADALAPHTDCVLRIAPGGRLESLNPAAEQVFHVSTGEQVSLERIARRVRPSDTLLQLCAAEGRAEVVVDNRPMEGNSFRLADSAGNQMVVILRAKEPGSRKGKAARDSLGISPDVLEFSQHATASLDLDEIFRSVAADLDRIIPADVMEITLHDAGLDNLTPYRALGAPGSGRTFKAVGQDYPPGAGLSGKVYQRKEAILASVLEVGPELQPAVDLRTLPLRSYLGVPLIVGQECIGTLELGSYIPGQFQQNDLDLLAVLAPSLAAGLVNARRYQQEQQRADELGGIAELTQVFREARDPHTLFTNLVNAIAPLVDVHILGFFMFNEHQRMLESQAPFLGLPGQVLELYNVEVGSSSPLEEALLAQQTLVSENAFEDQTWLDLGLENLARGASLRETVMMPLTSGGRMLGYLQAANHRDHSRPFTEGELQFLRIIANQAAPVIENANLIIQSHQRAIRAEGLRRIASLAGSDASLEETLKYSLQELAHLVQADLGAVFLIDPGRSTLGLHRASLYGNRKRLKHQYTHLPVEDAQFPFTVTGTQHVIQYNRFQADENPLVPFYRELMIQWNLDAMIIVPLLVRDEGIGELWLGVSASRTFDQADVQVAFTAAGQLAGVIDQSNRSGYTDDSLRERVDQLTGLARFSRELSALREPTQILELVQREALRVSGADCGTVMLVRSGQILDDTFVPVEFVGCVPQDRLPESELAALRNRENLQIEDLALEGQASIHTDGSLLLLPVVFQNEVNAIIHLHAKRTNFFSSAPMDILQSIASQSSVAIANALQFEERGHQSQLLKRELDTLSELLDLLRGLQPQRPLEEGLDLIATAIQKATPFRSVLISIQEPGTGELRRVSGRGIPAEIWEELRTRVQPWAAVAQIMDGEFKVGCAYFIPADRLPLVPADVHAVTFLEQPSAAGEADWHPDDMLLIPLEDAQGEVLGLISLDDPEDGRRPDQLSIDALELFSRQAAVLIQNHRRLSGLDTEIAELSAQAGELNQTKGHAEDQTAVLLRKDLELTLAIHALQTQIESADAGMILAEQIGAQEEPLQILRLVAQALMDRYGLSTVLLAEQTQQGARLLQVIGESPKRANPEALFGQVNPLRYLLEQDQIILEAELTEGMTWYDNPLVMAFNGCSLLGLPFHSDVGQQAALLGISQVALLGLNDRERLELTRLTRQVNEALQKLHLLSSTRERLEELNLLLNFSRRLGSLDEVDILQSLVDTLEQAIPAAQACWAGKPAPYANHLEPIAATGYVDSEYLFKMRFQLDVANEEIHSLPVRVFLSGQEELLPEVAFTREYPLLAEDLLKLRRATGGKLPIASLVLPLQRGEDKLGIVVIESFTSGVGFTSEDLQLAQALVQQAALALENCRLFADTRQRTAQLQALTEVSTTITSSLKRDDQIRSLLAQLRTVIPYETATLWLRDARMLTVAAANGFDDNESRVGLTVMVEDSRLFQEMVESGQPIVVSDVTHDDRFQSLVEPEYRSWMGIPLIAKAQLVGAIALEKREPGFYHQAYVQVGATFAGQAAVSLDNARLFEESQERAAELDIRSRRLVFLNRYSTELGTSLDVNFIQKMTSKYLKEALPVDHVAMVMLGEEQQPLLVHESPATNERLPLGLPAAPWFELLTQSGGSFASENVMHEPELAPLAEVYFNPRDIQSLLAIPLIAGNAVTGWIWLQNKEHIRFELSDIELARTISNQTSIAIQNARLLQETISLTQDLEARVVTRTEELQREHENTQTLLRIITELTSSLDINQVLNRTLNVLNEALGSEMSMILLNSMDEVYHAGRLAHLRWSGNPASLEAEIARWVITNRMSALSDEITQDDRWKPRTAQTIIYRSALAVPLVLGEEVLGSLMLFHRKTAQFQQVQVNMVEAAARQISIALNNAELFKLIREQAENLGNMLREQQIETSRSRAILEAVADGVIVTDEEKRITLLNPSASRILGFDAGSAIDQSLDDYSSAFGGKDGMLFQTIDQWTADPSTCQLDASHTQQIELQDGRVIAISLAPVVWRAQFLGTVSIFRDITQEVQVDRLKSEFVANVSHELRTPMTSIKGYVEVILMGAAGPINEQQEKFLSIVKGNTERLSELVNDLLDISRIEAGRVVLTLQPLDMVEVANDIRSDILRRSVEENKAIQIDLQIPKRLPRVSGDPDRIRQVLANLVSNAYFYTEPAGRIEVRLRVDGTFMEVAVQDNGIGIKAEDQGRIFERFYRGEDPLVLASSGTGLGLPISRTLVEMHHGKMWYESTGVRGEGSTFFFTLPIYRKGGS